MPVGSVRSNGTTARSKIVHEMLCRRVSAILRTEDPAIARDAMHAAVAGGFRMIEFTLTIPGAVGLIAEFSANRDLLVGAGTVLDRDQARAAVAAGAQFLVSPVLDPAMIEEAHNLGVAALPGAYTPTEMLAAYRLGADFVKLFPAPADTVRFLTQLRGPLPFLRVFPTAGATPDNFADILRAGAAGVGFVSSLFPADELRARSFLSIERRASLIHDRLAEV